VGINEIAVDRRVVPFFLPVNDAQGWQRSNDQADDEGCDHDDRYEGKDDLLKPQSTFLSA
jgi:hypothetical protein